MKPILFLACAAVTLLPVASPAAVTVEYVPASTRRIAQVTGNYDPEGLPHVNDTVPWGVDGVDLGANTEHDGKLFFFFGDVPQWHRPPSEQARYPPSDSDLVAYTTDAYPEPNGIHLTPVLRSDGLFDPYQMRTWLSTGWITEPLLTNQTPSGAFSYNGRAYVFAVRNLSPNLPYGEWVSYLTSSCDPAGSAVFDLNFELSRVKFMQVAPWVVKNAAILGLPSSQGDGLIMFGHGGPAFGWGVHLAWMPLQPGRHPDPRQIRYWTGTGWSPPMSVDMARPLFSTTHNWTSLSVGRIKESGLWILLYQKAVGPKEDEDRDGPIIARVAATPWDIAGAAEIPIFDPGRDGAVGKYMHRPGMDDPSRWPPGLGGLAGFAYGAYLLNRYTLWDAQQQIVTLWYLMSTGTPYQVQLMRSQIRITE